MKKEENCRECEESDTILEITKNNFMYQKESVSAMTLQILIIIFRSEWIKLAIKGNFKKLKKILRGKRKFAVTEFKKKNCS